VKDIIKSSLGIETEGYTHQLFFYYPAKGGIFFLIDSIKKNVKNIRPNFNIKKIKKHHGGWLVSDGDTTKKFDRIVSTIPLQELIKCLDDVPKAVREAADNLKYNSLVTLGICIGEKEKTNMSWLYMPQSDVLFHRLVYLNNYSKLTAPLGKSSLIAEFTYNEDSNIGKMSDAELKKHTIRALKDKLGIDTVTNIVVFRTEYAYVVYNLNYCKDLKIIKDYLHKLGIVLCGRFGEHKYMNMDECIKSAKTTAEEMNKYN